MLCYDYDAEGTNSNRLIDKCSLLTLTATTCPRITVLYKCGGGEAEAKGWYECYRI